CGVGLSIPRGSAAGAAFKCSRCGQVIRLAPKARPTPPELPAPPPLPQPEEVFDFGRPDPEPPRPAVADRQGGSSPRSKALICGPVVGGAALVGLAVLVALAAMTPDRPRKQPKEGATDADLVKSIVSTKREKKKAGEPDPDVNEAAPAGAEKPPPAAE